MDVAKSVLERYSSGAHQREQALCCPVDYDASLLEMLPKEIIEKDYGCGDPSRYVQSGDTVLDLGSGGGKICYMAAQLVGEQGKVIGVDFNDDMLSLARKYQNDMARKLGSDRVVFHKAAIQDLALDLSAVNDYLNAHPVTNVNSLRDLQRFEQQLRQEAPLIADESVDLVISNCVLNLVDDQHKQPLFQEIYRVLKPGGRIAISDIVADEPIPQHLKHNAELWSGCISGAFTETAFIQGFIDSGFIGANFDKWDVNPWRVVEGIEFRSVTLTAVKGDNRACLDMGHAVIYRGPFKSVFDDEGHEYFRGERMAVCERTYDQLTRGVYAKDFIGIMPAHPREPVTWCAPSGTRRAVKETKGAAHHAANSQGSCC